ncbi:MAG: M16 family metallopeptidase, partial [Caulobacteraceae bacterium]
MEVIADLVLRPKLDAADLRQEVGVIAQEIAEAADTPDDFVFEIAQAAAFGETPLGRPVLGTEASIGEATPATLEAWRGRLYAPGGLVVSAAGAVDEMELVDLAERLFGEAPARAAPAAPPARFVGGRAGEARRLEQAHLVFLLPGVSATDPGNFASRLFAEALGGGMSSRLFQEARERLGLAYAIDAFSEAYADTGLVGIYAGCAAKDAKALATVAAGEVRKLAAGVEPKELARCKAQLKASLFMARESLAARAEQAAAQLLVFGRLLTAEEIAAAIDAVTPEAFAAAGGRLLSQRLAAPAVLGPARALPAADRFSDVLFG